MRRFLFFLSMTLFAYQGHAQENLDSFRNAIRAEFNDFRKACMDEFTEFVRDPWKEFEEEKPVPFPKEEQKPPVVMPIEERGISIENRPIIIQHVIPVVQEEVQPKPIEPIRENTIDQDKYVHFTFYGSVLKVRFNIANKIELYGLDENSIADALNNLDHNTYDNLLYDCLKIREELKLCDWSYLELLRTVSDTIEGKGTNEAALVMAFLYLQSGYKMRLATDGKKLFMLFASKHEIYDRSFFQINDERYYGIDALPKQLYICQAAFPNEKSLSLRISNNQLFSKEMSVTKTRRAVAYRDICISASVNKNLIDFYNNYPSSSIGGDFMTRWAMYANTPMDATTKNDLYSTLRKHINGLSEKEAVERLLNWVQTAFVYEYDDKVWGHDRAFFAEESLYYPYCDCEDRSILLSRLVRDLLGLKVVLVYYPGHLATAIHFTNDVRGDYLVLGGQRYTVCDPTYIGAPVGRTMPGMDNNKATVILLN